MGAEYQDYDQFIASYDSEPFLYAIITTADETFTCAERAQVIVDSAGDRTAAKPSVVGFGDILEIVSEGVEPSRVELSLRGMEFPDSLLKNGVEIYLGATTLSSDNHALIYQGIIVEELRRGRRLLLSVQEGLYTTLSRIYLPGYVVADQHPLAPEGSRDEVVPIAVGELYSSGGASGRLSAIPLGSVAGGYQFLICEHEYGETFSVPRVWKNEIEIYDAVAEEVAGEIFDYIKVTVPGASVTDEITVDILRRTYDPIEDLRFLLARMGVSQDCLGAPRSITGFSSNGAGGTTVSHTGPAFEIGDEVTIYETDNYNSDYTVIAVAAGEFEIDTPYVGDDARGKAILTPFTEAKQTAAARLYKCGGLIDTPRSGLKIVSEFITSFGASSAAGGGMWNIHIDDQLYDFDAPDYHEGANILFDSSSVGVRDAMINNAVNYSGLADANGRYRLTGNVTDALSIAEWGRKEDSLEANWAGDKSTVVDVARRRIFDRSAPRAEINFSTYLAGLNSELLSTIRFTSENLSREFCRVGRRSISGADFSISIEATQIGNAAFGAFRLGAEEDASAPDDLRNSSVFSSNDVTSHLVLDAGGDSITCVGALLGDYEVKVGDLLTIDPGDGTDNYINAGRYEVTESGKSIGEVVSNGSPITVIDPTTGGAITFLADGGGDELVYDFYFARAWITADENQRLQGHIANGGDISSFSDAGSGKVRIASTGHQLSESDTIGIWGGSYYDGYHQVMIVDADSFDITADWLGVYSGAVWGKTNYSDGQTAKTLI